ncbi:hypothetical protein MSG28_014705 [Choristoneura fumiferana]|uniref:Uncharacterized protein n=1 Tax=Choristoneura fumiferana TaxID=7141 RepID=A0ACC0JSR3_CHOFU|nr:hypothetical protein MSG28_014705 [Choristoneura fumiferana]
MAFSVVFTLLTLSVVSFATEVPVYLWGDLSKTSLKSSPLYTVEPQEFSAILKEELSGDPFTVIFIEETLSVEDFSRKNADGETSFPFLRANVRDSAYLPSVENALQALNKLADPEKVDHVKLTENGLSAEIEPESGKFLFINLKDAKESESRSDLLRRHNDFMEDMFTKLQERYNKVVAIYTAHFPSWTVPVTHSRVRRQADEKSTRSYSFDGLALAVSEIMLHNGTAPMIVLTNGVGTTEFNETVQDSTLTFGDTKLVLHFTQESGYWLFNSVTVNIMSGVDVLMPNQEVNAILGFSYRCAENVTFGNVNHTVVFRDMKIQPFFEAGNTSTRVFGDSFNCVGFFSAPIWAGIFVTFVLLLIMAYGVMMMMDIRTMDRFDDPKGKTITINASE